jgi:hypothetical protein
VDRVRLLRSLDAPYAEYYAVVVALRHAPAAADDPTNNAADGTAALRVTAEARCASLREAMRAACGGDEAAVARRLEEIHAQVSGYVLYVYGAWGYI